MDRWQQWRKRAKQWKKDNQLTDAHLADALGVERPTVNSWFNKREPNLSDFMALCAAMGVDPGQILFGDDLGREGRSRPAWVKRSEIERRTPGDRRGNGQQQPPARPLKPN